MSTYLEENKLFPEEYKGCCKGSYDCKDKLLINKAVSEYNHRYKMGLN